MRCVKRIKKFVVRRYLRAPTILVSRRMIVRIPIDGMDSQFESQQLMTQGSSSINEGLTSLRRHEKELKEGIRLVDVPHSVTLARGLK